MVAKSAFLSMPLKKAISFDNILKEKNVNVSISLHWTEEYNKYLDIQTYNVSQLYILANMLLIWNNT
jgi:hypothetical protein